MENKLIGLLVGMHFNPPAKALLASLPAGAILRLEPEPENPYDANAVRVFCRTSALVAGEALGLALAEMGREIGEVLAELEWPLGHLAASGGKPLAKAGITELVGTVEFLASRPAEGLEWLAKLRWSPGGLPLVVFER
jgi:hypothetical protein